VHTHDDHTRCRKRRREEEKERAQTDAGFRAGVWAGPRKTAVRTELDRVAQRGSRGSARVRRVQPSRLAFSRQQRVPAQRRGTLRERQMGERRMTMARWRDP